MRLISPRLPHARTTRHTRAALIILRQDMRSAHAPHGVLSRRALALPQYILCTETLDDATLRNALHMACIEHDNVTVSGLYRARQRHR